MKRLDDTPDDTVTFRIRLVPRASRNEVVGWGTDGALRVRVKAAPVEEAANLELVKFLSKTLDVPKRELRIVSGVHARSKRIAAPRSCKNRLSTFQDI